MYMYKPRKTGHSFLGKIGFDEFWAFFKREFAMNRSNTLHLQYIHLFILFQCCFLEEKSVFIPKNGLHPV